MSKYRLTIAFSVLILLLAGVVLGLYHFGDVERLKDSLQQRTISTGMLNYGTMGQIFKKLRFVTIERNDFSHYQQTSNSENGESLGAITFQRKREVDEYLYAASSRSERSFRSTEAIAPLASDKDWPIISLFINDEYLNDPHIGLLTNKEMKGGAWERPAEVTYKDKDEILVESYAGIRLHGGVNIDKENYIHGYRIYFRQKYGLNALPAGVILPPLGVPLRTVVIKTPTWLQRYPLNNPIAYDIAREIGCEAPQTQLVRIFVNGDDIGFGYAVEHISRRQWGQRIGHDDYLLYAIRANNSDADTVRYLQHFGSIIKDPENFSITRAEQSIDLDSLFKQIISWAFCGTDDYCQGAAILDLRDADAKGFYVNWDMDLSFRDGRSGGIDREKWEQPGVGRQYGQYNWKKDCFQSVLFTLLMDQSPQHRDTFLSLLVTTLNHKLTEDFFRSLLAYYKDMLERIGTPHHEYFEMLENYTENRSEFLLDELKELFSLTGPFELEVLVPKGVRLDIDGHNYSQKYRGSYFSETELKLAVPLELVAHFSHWVINGKIKYGDTLSLIVEKDCVIEPVFKH